MQFIGSIRFLTETLVLLCMLTLETKNSMVLNCVVVDNSKTQRLLIEKLIKNHDCLKLVAQYKCTLDAKKGLNNIEVDLIFLNIEMPILSGFELLDELNNKPQVIFVSSETEYAFKAFDYGATDYLQKPIAIERFDFAIKKALNHYRLRINTSETDDKHIFVKSNLKKQKVYIKDIKWIQALGDYIQLVTEEKNLVVLSTMKSFEKELPEGKFFRIHKSYIVSLDKIVRFNSKNVEIGTYEIPLSRNKKTQLADALNSMSL